MAEYNVDIQVRAKAKQAERELERVKRKLDDLSKGAAKIDFSAPERAIRNLGRTARNVGNEIKNIFGRGLFAGAVMGASQLPGAFQAATAKLGVFQGAVTSFGNAVDSHLGGIPHLVGEILGAVGQLPNSFGIAAVAAMAFAPQLLKASSAAVGLGDAVDKAVGKQVTEAIADAGSKVAGLNAQVNATKASFADLIKGSTLNQLNAQLSDARHEMGEYHSSTKQAVVAAEQLAAVLKEQKAEQQAITDLARQAQGLPTASEDRRAMNKFRRVQNRKEFERQNKLQLEGVQNALKEMEIKDSILENERLNIKAQEVQNRLDKQAIASNTQKVQSLRRQAEIQERISKSRSANIVREQAAARAAFLAGDPNAFPGGVQNPSERGFRLAQIRKEGEERLAALKRFAVLEREIDASREKRALQSYNTRQRRRQFLADQEEQSVKRIEELRRKAGQRAESLALGIGFPLLFGGGAGSVAGGALGSVLGSQGFGGQIIFSAIGQQIDTVVANVAKLGQALNPLTLDLDAVTTAAGVSGTALEKYLKELENTAGKAKAAEEAQKALAAVVGDEGIDALEEFGEATQNLSNAFDRAMSRMAAGVARLINSIPGFLQFTSNLERGGVLQRALASTDPAQAGNLQLLEQARVGKGGVDIGKYESAIEALIRTQRTIEAGGGSAQDMTILKRQLEVDKARVALTRAGNDLADDAVFKARQQLQIKEHALRIEEVSQKDLTDAARNAEFEKLALRDERERVQLASDRAAALSKAAKKGAKEGERVAKEVALLKIRNGLTGTMLTLDTQIADAKRQGRVEDAEDLERSKVLLQGLAKEKELRIRIKDATQLAAEIRANDLNTQTELAKLAAGVDDRKKNEADRAAETMAGLQNQLELEQARLDGKSKQVELEQRAAEIASQNKDLSADAVLAVLKQIDAAKQLVSEQERMKQVFADIGMTIKDGIVDAIGAAVDGTKSLAEVASNMLNNIANKLLNVAVNMALFGVPMGVGKGGLFGGFFADGGRPPVGKASIVGERGPELFVPRTSGTIVPNNALGGGVGNIVVNVDATGSSAEGNASGQKQLGEAIGIAIRQELIKQKRPGGLLA